MPKNYSHLQASLHDCARAVLAMGMILAAGNVAAASEVGVSPTLGVDHGAFDETVVYGLNLGGGEFLTLAGEPLAADNCSSAVGGADCGALTSVARTQNPELYQSFRIGEQEYRIDLPNGEYDVVLYFVEADPEAGRTRRFNVLLEGETALENFNLLELSARQSAAAMTRAFPRVAVKDSALDIELRAVTGDPILSGILVRRSRFSEDGWNLVWSDEFDGGDLRGSVWTAENWPPAVVNDEEQAYTDRERNVRMEKGMLVLEAHRAGGDAAYTSGRVHSAGKQSFQYGRLDIRARVPEGKGVWPALWLLPEDPYRYATRCGNNVAEWQGNDDCDAWPNSGEIDLMEHVGYEPGVVHGTVHTRDYYGGRGTQIGEAVVIPDLGEAFHVYSLVWEPGRLAMYVDGVRYFAYFENGEGIGQWPFDHAFHVVMNLAVGGAWGAALGPVDPRVFPRRLEVDYLRLFKASGTPSSGTIAAD